MVFPLCVAIAEDNPAVRALLHAYLSQQPKLAGVLEADSGAAFPAEHYRLGEWVRQTSQGQL